MEQKKRNLVVLSLTILGTLSLTTGTILNFQEPKQNKINTDAKLVLNENIRLTPVNQVVKVNQALPSKISDYIKEKVSSDILDKVTLDTSKVDISKPGTYEYTLTYQKTTRKGIITVESVLAEAVEIKPETATVKLTLKDITLKRGEILPMDLASYIVEPLDSETMKKIQLALPSQGITSQTGTYTYNVKFNDMVYTGTITVQEDQTLIQKPNVIEKDEDPSTILTTENQKQEEKKN